MNKLNIDNAQLLIFLPCAGGVEQYLQQEVENIVSKPAKTLSGGVLVHGDWQDILRLNLHSRLAQRVLLQLSRSDYRTEQDIYDAARQQPWENWFTIKHSFRVEITARKSPLKSLNFAALRVKDGVVDRFRENTGLRPNVERDFPDVRIYTHLSNDRVTLYLDTSGDPLFKRGWRLNKGDAPLKETLAAAMLVASNWRGDKPLYDPCCGSGTIAIEAAQMISNIAPGLRRQFAFEKLAPFQAKQWQQIKQQAQQAIKPVAGLIFASDVAHRMVDFAEQNARRAGVEQLIQFRGGDALQRMPPTDQPGLMLLNPPYGERIDIAGVAKQHQQQPANVWRAPAREQATTADGADFFVRLAAHWKHNYSGWQAWILAPDMKLPSRMRLKESRRVPLWNGPIECRLFCFDLIAGSARAPKKEQ